MKDREIRTFVSKEMRVVRQEGESPKIVGHAAVFNSATEIGSKTWGWEESIAPGAFTDSIEVDDVRALFNHDPNFVLGRNVAGTLKLSEDKKGLKYVIDPPDTTVARDLMESIDRGDITGSSFGFEVLEQKWSITSDDTWDQRQLTKVKLWDVSPVTFPAYDDTDVAKRQYQEQRDKVSGSEEKDLKGKKPQKRSEHETDFRVIPFSRHESETLEDVDAEWDGAAERTAATVDELKMMSLFEDREHLDVKTGYKGHHHTADGNRVNFNGVRAAMGNLRGARGGFKDVPTSELSRGWTHLSKHYAEFDMDPPDNPFRSNLNKMDMRMKLSEINS